MKRLTGLALIVGLAASLLLYVPMAQSIPAASGHVSGVVATEGSLFEEVECVIDPNSPGYTFTGVAIEGSFVDASNNVFSGLIPVSNVKGRAQVCNTSGIPGDSGNVNSETDPAYFTGSGLNSIVGIFFGSYHRDATHTQVILDVYSRIGGTDWNTCVNRNIFGQITGANAANCPHGIVYVSAEFAPNMADHLDGSWSRADFHGTWGTTKTWAP